MSKDVPVAVCHVCGVPWGCFENVDGARLAEHPKDIRLVRTPCEGGGQLARNPGPSQEVLKNVPLPDVEPWTEEDWKRARAVVARISTIEVALRSCEHPFARDTGTWCNVCGATKLPSIGWVQPAWRDLVALAFQAREAKRREGSQ